MQHVCKINKLNPISEIWASCIVKYKIICQKTYLEDKYRQLNGKDGLKMEPEMYDELALHQILLIPIKGRHGGLVESTGNSQQVSSHSPKVCKWRGFWYKLVTSLALTEQWCHVPVGLDLCLFSLSPCMRSPPPPMWVHPMLYLVSGVPANEEQGSHNSKRAFVRHAT